MLGASQGFIIAILAMIGGVIISAALSGMGNEIPNINTWKALFDLIAVLGIITTIENANYWGIMYSLGYLAGISLFGKYLLPQWEIQLISVVLVVYIVIKILRKF